MQCIFLTIFTENCKDDEGPSNDFEIIPENQRNDTGIFKYGKMFQNYISSSEKRH